jgi:hypothetical protein
VGYCPFKTKYKYKKLADLQLPSKDRLGLAPTPLSIRWTIPLKFVAFYLVWFQTETALIYDAVMLFAVALDSLDQSQVSVKQIGISDQQSNGMICMYCTSSELDKIQVNIFFNKKYNT